MGHYLDEPVQKNVIEMRPKKGISSGKKQGPFKNTTVWTRRKGNKHSYNYKEPFYQQLALGWQIAKQRSGLNPISLSYNKNYR